MQSDTNLWHHSDSRKAINIRDVGNSKEPTQQQEHQHKRQQQQELCGKAKSGRKWSRIYGCECGSDKKNLVAVEGPQVAVVFARSGRNYHRNNYNNNGANCGGNCGANCGANRGANR